MAKMLYLLFDWEYPLVMMAGAILVLFGFIGFAFNQNRNVGPIMSRRNEGEREMTMKALVIFTVVCFSTSAYAQGAPPKAGNKPLVQVKPKEPMECKLVGRVKGTKLWAGDCVGPELRGAIPSTETQSVPEPPTGAIPPDQK